MRHRLVILAVYLTVSAASQGESIAAELVTPADDAPLYQLSNLRTERGRFGKSSLALDFRRTRPGKGSVSVGGKSGNSRLSISVSVPSSQDSGTIRMQSLFSIGGDITQDIELYFIQRYQLSATKSVDAMLSNAVRLGNPGTPSTARALTSQEKVMQKEFARIMSDDSAHKPPKEYPVSVQPTDGYEFVPNTAKLTKGTRLHACYQDTWHPLTTISENDDGTVNVRWDKYGSQYDCSMSRGELIIETSLVNTLDKHAASRFAATVPNWSSASAKDTAPPSPGAKPRKRYAVSIDVPSDSVVVPKDLKIKPGIPLQACYAGKWNPITALRENEDGTLNVHWDDYGSSSDCSMVRDELIIKKDLAQQLRTNPASVTIAAPAVVAKPRKTYKVSIPVPSDSEFVPNDAKLKPGTKLQACYASKWNPITFLSHNTDGSLNVRWDDYGSAFDCSMIRNELIIKKSALKASAPSDAPVAEMRTFTDVTGKFKVKAKVMKQSDSQVTLLTEKGREITLPLSKLSEADQDFLRSRVKKENPFE